MDTTYIKQCDCPEVQEQHFAFMGFIKQALVMEQASLSPRIFEVMGDRYYNDGDKVVWLPHQEDLQAMVMHTFLEPRTPFILLEGFYYWASDTDCDQFTSMEQLLLAFVMESLYSKVWSNDAWVKESK